MDQRRILLACTVLAVVNSLAACAFPFNTKHLDWFFLDTYYLVHRTQTKLSLEKIGVNSGDLPNIIKEKIAVRHELSRDNHDKSVYEDLCNLADSEVEGVMENEINRILEIYAIMWNAAELRKFVPFFIAYGRDKFGARSLTDVNKLKNGTPENERALERLDQFFAALFDMDKPNDNQILLVLKHYNFEQSFPNPKEAIRLIAHPTVIADSNSALVYFFKFMFDSCFELQKGREKALRVISLADEFHYVPPADRDTPKVLKVKEYYRLCLSLWREERDRIIRNMGNLILERSNTNLATHSSSLS